MDSNIGSIIKGFVLDENPCSPEWQKNLVRVIEQYLKQEGYHLYAHCAEYHMPNHPVITLICPRNDTCGCWYQGYLDGQEQKG